MSSNWIDRMNNMEATPPENGWNNVAAALDESMNGSSFPATLYEAEATPPLSVWAAISNELDGEATPVVEMPKRKVMPAVWRYAVAACLIGLVAFAAIRFMGKNADGSVAETNIDTASAPTNNTKTITESKEPESTQQTVTETQAQSDDAALEKSKQTYASLDLTTKRSYNKLVRSPAQLASFTSATTAAKPEIQYSHRAAVTDSPVEKADRYAMYRDEDGRSIRISKKLSELICCVSGEVQNDECSSKLKEWRQKIASSPFNPSPDNFMDILDLINSIQDSRN